MLVGLVVGLTVGLVVGVPVGFLLGVVVGCVVGDNVTTLQHIAAYEYICCITMNTFSLYNEVVLFHTTLPVVVVVVLWLRPMHVPEEILH